MLQASDVPLKTYKNILETVSQETIMEYYLDTPVTGEMVCSPFRADHKPGCSFWKSQSGILYFKD